ncbi:hypothetical protein [Pseudomonas mosselii]|uniref:Lipoprotein n=1 Tax=Pseudomonas mosselii TaxID=78327 RepID=A0ABX9B9B4_9PSED|nr:hypothetical protein [Pseudomonas mosselii]MBS9764102.1 hypothetical protein [Pseudomonas mosselii]MCH7419318.1 hypothetical protein [Pseudomonas mosselii]MCL8300372.1 hypothetical protein [Pseudomonas mosselii]MCL8339999.1 hypothetical protein [Pseudomonas mosselii]MDH0627462.1 hypothetical protein [Pseudomonas mosselii]
MDRKIIPLALLATLVGCSDGQQPDEAELRQAAQAYLDTRYPHCFVISAFPTRTRDFDVEGTNKALHALARVGVVSEREVARTEVPERLWQPARTDIYYAYDLTDEGRRYYKADARPRANGASTGGLCFGKARVTAVKGFSAPVEHNGRRQSQVTYSYQVTELPVWASDAAVQANIAGLGLAAGSSAKPLEETRSMVLTAQGWVHEQLLAN